MKGVDGRVVKVVTVMSRFPYTHTRTHTHTHTHAICIPTHMPARNHGIYPIQRQKMTRKRERISNWGSCCDPWGACG